MEWGSGLSIVLFTLWAYGLRSHPFCGGKARSAGRPLGLFLSSTQNTPAKLILPWYIRGQTFPTG
jgi:hypothetical protein